MHSQAEICFYNHKTCGPMSGFTYLSVVIVILLVKHAVVVIFAIAITVTLAIAAVANV